MRFTTNQMITGVIKNTDPSETVLYQLIRSAKCLTTNNK